MRLSILGQRRWSALAFTVIGAVVSAGNIAARTPPLQIANVAVSRGSFNPRSGASVALTVTLNRSALLDVEVVDRDGYVLLFADGDIH